MFRIVLFLQTTTLLNVKKELRVRCYYKVGSVLLQSGAALMYYISGQVVLLNRISITN